MSTKILFVHLSDIHLEAATDGILSRAKNIAATTYKHLPQVSAVFLIISGDIAWSGKKSEYALAEQLIGDLIATLRVESPDLRVETFVCPGNHDCDFSKHDETREAVLLRIRALDSPTVSDSLVKTASSVQDEFFEFRNRISPYPWTRDTKLSWQVALDLDGIRVGMRCLNVAWMSELREKQGSLVYPPSAVVPFDFDKNAGLTVTLLHHPFNWFGQSSYRAFQSTVRRESHLVFTGHEHFQSIGEISETRSTPSIFVDGGVLYERKEPDKSTFNMVVVDLKSEQYSSEMFAWTGSEYMPDLTNEETGSLRALPVKGATNYRLRDEFAQSLTDAGANFSHSAKKRLELNDIFVWPELVDLDDRAIVKKQVSGSFFEDINNLNSGVFIRGDEKAGKSTLLRQYFSSYYERGYLPLYVRASWITQVHQDDSAKLLRQALERQYLRTDHERWLQEPKAKRILFLDDIDNSVLDPKVLSAALTAIFKSFAGMIVTARDGAAAMDILSIDGVDALSKFHQYEIREFGHKKRFELVCKWVEVGGSQDDASAGWNSTIDKFENDLTTAVGRQFVPSVPIFLLTLLQSMEAGRTADLQNSAFGHYYQFLVTSSFQSVGIDRQQWNEVINYCANLAWYVHNTGRKHFTESELENYNRIFTEEFTPVDFSKRLRDLLEAAILARFDDDLEFKYPYLYYYFLGQYLADRIHQEETQQEIIRLADDLHLRDNANILLFTSHHTKDPVVYEKIASALARCFPSSPVFDFERDSELLNKLVDSAPKLVYREGAVKSTRGDIRDAQDRDPQFNEETADDMHAGSVASVTRLFRGMEILGQFLKNHYGTTKNPIKEELIEGLVNSALRGLHATTRQLITDSEGIAGYIAKALAKRSPNLTHKEVDKLAKRVVFDIIGLVTYAFVNKAGSAVGSAYLKDNLKAFVEKNPTLGNELVQMSYLLDLPEAIPFARLKALNKDVEGNVFSRGLLTTMALRHLHLFKVNYKDKQRLCEEFDIGVQKQKPLLTDKRRKEY